MIRDIEFGLGTKLRLLLAQLDGELSAIYKDQGSEFRPRFYPVFQLLLRRKQASVSEIANRLQASQPAATQTVAEMRKLDLVKFEAGRDKRKRIVMLTTHALNQAKALQPTWDAVRGAALKLDEELSHPLSDILDEALTALEQQSFPDRIAECRKSLEE